MRATILGAYFLGICVNHDMTLRSIDEVLQLLVLHSH